MSSREDILQSIRRNTRVRYEKPDYLPLEQEAMTYLDKLARFQEVMTQVGGRAVILQEGEDLVAACMSEVTCGTGVQRLSCATFHPDDVEKPADLDGTDLAIIRGSVGVCENGAVWICQEVEQRAVYFISEALVILLDRKNLVNNMHEAYKRIDTGDYGYGVFISGPSKTADIEQALVMGAHGARDVTVILL